MNLKVTEVYGSPRKLLHTNGGVADIRNSRKFGYQELEVATMPRRIVALMSATTMTFAVAVLGTSIASASTRPLPSFGSANSAVVVKASSVLAATPDGGEPSIAAVQTAFLDNMGDNLISWDTFGRGDQSLSGSVAPSGETYATISNPVLQPFLQSGAYVRSPSATFGSNGSSFLYSPQSVLPTSIAGLFQFTPYDIHTPNTPATTRTEAAVIGATASVFSRSSVQFLVSPTGWTLFYTVARTTLPGTAVVTLARGLWSAPLAVDADTIYTSAMKLDTTTRPDWTVRAELNDAFVTSYSGPEVKAYWGSREGVQIMHPRVTDGDVQVLGRAACFGESFGGG